MPHDARLTRGGGFKSFLGNAHMEATHFKKGLPLVRERQTGISCEKIGENMLSNQTKGRRHQDIAAHMAIGLLNK